MELKKYWKQSALIKDQKLKSKNGGLEIKGTENEGPEKEGPENREPFKLFWLKSILTQNNLLAGHWLWLIN